MTTISVEAESIPEIAEVFGFVDPADIEEPEYRPEVMAVAEAFEAVYDGVVEAVEQDERGRSRKMIQENSGMEDVDPLLFGAYLRVFEAQGILVHDGNRWRFSDA